jgi:hypothetical protein
MAMSINVYLRGEKAKDLPGFHDYPYKGNHEIEYHTYTAADLRLHNDGGRWYITLDRPEDIIPVVVKDLVEEISFVDYEALAGLPRREAGIYRYQKATATVEAGGPQRKPGIRIRSETMEDLRELLKKILTGTVRPDESFEREQNGESCAEIMRERSSLAEHDRELYGRLASERAEVDIFLRDLSSRPRWWRIFRWWPLCSRKRVLARLQRVLDIIDRVHR